MKEFQRLEKGAKGCMYLGTGTMSILGAAILSGLIFGFGWWDFLPVKIAYVAVMGLVILNTLVSPAFRYERYRYKIDDECIHVKEGYLWVTETIVPIERIQNLEVSQGPFDRYYKVAKVIVTTGGGEVSLSFIAKEKADEIAEYLKKRVNEAVVREREENGTE